MASRREIAASPSTEPRSARGSEDSSMSFDRKPAAPARRPRIPSASSVEPVRSTTRISSSCSWIRRVASMPSISGIM